MSGHIQLLTIVDARRLQFRLASDYTLVAVICEESICACTLLIHSDSSEGLLFYDTAIAFSQEYQVVWSRRVTGASAIYIALRYSNMMSAVVTLAELATPSCAVSRRMNYAGFLRSHRATPDVRP